jgi:hypothetical protein
MKQFASTNKKTIQPPESANQKSGLDKSIKDGKSGFQNNLVEEHKKEIPIEKIGK